MIQIFSDQYYPLQAYLVAGGVVMLPLLAISVVMWVLIINRMFFFRRLTRKNMTRERAARYIQENQIPDPGDYKGAIAMLVTEFQARRTGTINIDRNILDETVMSVVAKLDDNLTIIGVLAKVSPLLGLLGTVTGMIATFDIISVFGAGNVRAMAGGISEALITTQTGLMVAIPGLYAHNFLTRRAENLKRRVASVGMYLSRNLK
ncbi:MAG: MotA/TolQ/ExbB proton channel family protein [Desulfobacterales bacterium]|nr:MotA/TolQ/ExbB proton channel family protein [Desulfobacterales bacterium]